MKTEEQIRALLQAYLEELDDENSLLNIVKLKQAIHCLEWVLKNGKQK